MEEKDNLTLVEEQINYLLSKLGDTKEGTPEYDKISDEINELCRTRESYLKLEQQRLDSNAKNSVAEAELVLKQQELEIRAEDVKNGKIRNAVAIVTAIIYTVASSWQNVKSYKMDEETISYKGMKESSRKLLDKIPQIRN